MKLKISPAVLQKLEERHNVAVSEIIECFANRTGNYLLDNREEHRSAPPTQWFVSETDYAVKLKIMFIQHSDGTVEIKSAYTPSQTVLDIYNRKAY